MACRVLQANLNHAMAAQDMMTHSLAEMDCGLGIISEPYINRHSKEGPKWVSSSDSTAAIVWRRAR